MTGGFKFRVLEWRFKVKEKVEFSLEFGFLCCGAGFAF